MLLRNCIFLFLLITIAKCSPSSSDNPSPPKTPQEELNTFQLPSDLEIQLVASEPMIQDPVVIQFDEDGRLWVVEMRGFMPDIDGKGEQDRTGRISILEDTDIDGQFDKSHVFMDSLILPRALAIVKGGALVVEDYKLWFAKDINNDLVADEKILLDSTYGGTRLPEHSANGLWRGIDNWYYNARSAVRYKFDDGKITRDSTEFRGQWGMSHDDLGRLFYNYNWSQLHADLVPPNYLNQNKHHTPTSGIDHGLTLDRRVYPIRSNPAVNRGYIPGTLDEEGRLREFTAACSPFVYRGYQLFSYSGNAFVCEPSGNLIKRNVVVLNPRFNLTAHDPDPGHEFLASTDERFRPVYITSGRDGFLYVADMYRGLVQHGEYVTPYLREQTLKRKLDAPIHYGRIWRIGRKGEVPNYEFLKTKLSHERSEDLVKWLGFNDGWNRDKAQQLLIERKDTSIIDDLKDMIRRNNGNMTHQNIIHALWTLEGLNESDPELLYDLIEEPRLSAEQESVLRLMEPFLKSDKKFRLKVSQKLESNSDGYPPLQLLLTARYLEEPTAFKIYKRALEINSNYNDSPTALIPDAIISGLSGKELDFTKALIADDYNNNEMMMEALATAIVKRRKPDEISELLWLANTTIINAITIQGRGKWTPLKLKAAPRLSTVLNEQQSTIIKNMFEWPGHTVDVNAAKTGTQLSEKERELFASGRQQYLSVCAGCHGTNGEGVQRMAPPLAGSEWVTGDERRLALLVLHGIEGPLSVAGKTYSTPEILPEMPSHSTMDDENITSILIYIRNEWGNEAGGVNRRTVGRLRHTTQGRVMPWSAKDLDEHVMKLDTAKTE